MGGNDFERRTFLRGAAGLAAAGTYSLLVHAGPASAQVPDSVFDRIAPEDGGDAAVADEPNMTAVDLSCDLLVAGGGMAGVCAALAAARHGLQVILVQDRSRLGGNASSEVRMHIVGADCHGKRTGWREGGILEEMRLEYAARNPHFAWEMWDLMLYDKVVSEPNITLILDSALYRAEVADGLIKRAWVRCDKTEHISRITAPYFADCTGDCRLGVEAGATIRLGHEARGEFNEELAPESAGPETLGSSILFTSKDYGKPMPFVPPSWARKVTKDQLKLRSTRSWEYGYWWIEWGGDYDTIRDNERIRHELLSIVLGVWDYIKNSGEHPDSANWAMDWLGMIPGKRGSRRMEGPHVLNQVDCEGGWKSFHDGVTIGGWPFDDHPPNGFDSPDVKPARQVYMDEPYNIPLRSLFSANIGNLFMAGRNISASHVAFTSTRVMGTCSAAGQAMGTAVAACAAAKTLPADFVTDKTKVAWLQQVLIRDDQAIRGVTNEDPGDLARKARITASGAVEDSAPENVLTGELRDRTDPMANPWKNRWGCMMDGGDVWLALTWDEPQELRHVQLTFDSAFHRQLTLSEQAGTRKSVIQGAQPEVIRDYAIEYLNDSGEFQELVRVEGNVQRLRRHDVDAVKTTALRLRVYATNGADSARIYEVRCYASQPKGFA